MRARRQGSSGPGLPGSSRGGVRGARTARLSLARAGDGSGGDPAEIPKLSFAEFKGFHERYCAPSSAQPCL